MPAVHPAQSVHPIRQCQFKPYLFDPPARRPSAPGQCPQRRQQQCAPHKGSCPSCRCLSCCSSRLLLLLHLLTGLLNELQHHLHRLLQGEQGTLCHSIGQGSCGAARIQHCLGTL